MGKKSNHTGVITANYFFLSICISLIFAGSVLASDPAEDFKNLLVEETEYLVLQDFEFDEENMFLSAEYLYKPLGKRATLYLEYGEHEMVEEVARRFTTIGKIAQAWETRDIYSDMNRSESLEARSHFNEVVNNTEIFRWQKNHSTLLKDYPHLNAFPFETANASFHYYYQSHPKEVRALYEIEGSDREIDLRIKHGEAARQAGSNLHCGDPDIAEIAGYKFYESQGSSYTLRHLNDNVLVTVTKSYDEGDNRSEMNQTARDFTADLELETLNNQTYPKIEGPGNGLPFVQLESSDFEAIFPKQMENMTLQGVESYDDAMHVRADYLYEPEDHIIGLHLAFGEYTNRLQTEWVGSVGNFNSRFEFGCLREKISSEEFNNLRHHIIEPPAESDIAGWEMENIDYARVNPLAAFFPVEFNGYKIESFDPDLENPEVAGEYNHTDHDQSVTISVQYGDNAVRQYNRYQLRLFGDEHEKHTFDIGGRQFFGVDAGNSYLAHNFIDNLLVEARIETPDDLGNPNELTSKIRDVVNAFNIEPFYDWEAPEGFTMDFDGTMDDGTPFCLDTACMEEKLANCESAAFGGRIERRLGVGYEILEPAGDQCRMSMEYTRNPNDEWEDKPLYFLIDRDADFAESTREIVTDCMEGRTDAHDCSGPLLDVIEQ